MRDLLPEKMALTVLFSWDYKKKANGQMNKYLSTQQWTEKNDFIDYLIVL